MFQAKDKIQLSGKIAVAALSFSSWVTLRKSYCESDLIKPNIDPILSHFFHTNKPPKVRKFE